MRARFGETYKAINKLTQKHNSTSLTHHNRNSFTEDPKVNDGTYDQNDDTLITIACRRPLFATHKLVQYNTT